MEAVFIKLNKAYNLPDRDMLSENDVFVELKYGDKKHISSVKNNTAEPEWQDEMFIFSKQQNINTLSVVVWDRDGLVNDKLAEEYNPKGEFPTILIIFQKWSPKIHFDDLEPFHGLLSP